MSNLDLSRRGFLARLGACAAGGAALQQPGASGRSFAPATTVKWSPPPTLNAPNILVIMVDQMRWPQWLTGAQMQTLQRHIVPNIMGKLAKHSYVFDQNYTAATVCTAARGTLLTGLYAPQTAVYEVITNTSNALGLNPAFPTWGSAVQAADPAYKDNVWWFGKWHLSACTTTTPLQAYGFNTRTYPGGPNAYPSPDGFPNEGVNGGAYKKTVVANDDQIAGDFIAWLKGQAPTSGKPVTPWCATVSLINPHDIADAPSYPTTYFPRDRFPPPSGAPALLSALPSHWNYEDLSLVANKPPLQYAYFQSLNGLLGSVTDWTAFLNQYYWLQNYADVQVGRVLRALHNSAYAANTVVVFTSDHGEFGGSHGLHDKGDAAYDEGIRTPLYVSFPGQADSIAMHQMCSSVDFFGLICDLATGGSGEWRTAYPDLAGRQSLWNFLYRNSVETRTIANGPLAGMRYILHTSDLTSPATRSFNEHLVCLRTKNRKRPGAKLGVYSSWSPCTVIPNGTPQDFEFYDYSHNTAEMGNDYSAVDPNVQNYLSALGAWNPATGLIGSELNAPLEGSGTDGNPLSQAQAAARLNYFSHVGQTCSA